MIATILIVSLAFYWLLRETHWFTIHLPRGGSNMRWLHYSESITYATGFQAEPFKPSVFVPMDMPVLTGEYNIKI